MTPPISNILRWLATYPKWQRLRQALRWQERRLRPVPDGWENFGWMLRQPLTSQQFLPGCPCKESILAFLCAHPLCHKLHSILQRLVELRPSLLVVPPTNEWATPQSNPLEVPLPL